MPENNNEVLELDTPTEEPKPEETPAEPEKPAEEPEEQKVPISRLNEVSSKKKDVETERDYWRQKAMESQFQPPAPAVDAEPKQEDFPDNYEGFIRAQGQWAGRQAGQRAAEAAIWRANQDAISAKRVNQVKEIIGKNTEFAEAAPVVGTYFQPGMEAYESLIESPQLEAITVFLGKNPGEIARIASMSAREQAKAIGRLEARFENSNGSPPAARKSTSAPPPPQTLVTGNETAVRNLEKMDQASYNEYMNKKYGMY